MALAMASPSIAQTTSTLSYNSPGSEDATATAGVQAGSAIGAGDFVNEAVATSVPEEDFQNTALSAADESTIVGDVATTGSYSGTTATLSAATTAGESSDEDDSSSVSASTTAPVLLAAAAACVIAIAAIAIVKKRSDSRIPSPHTPVDKAIYYQVDLEAQKQPRFFHVKKQLTPTVCTL